MRILLVHPQDLPHRWATQKWDRIVDLSWAPAKTYAGWEKGFDCPIEPLDRYSDLEKDLDLVRDIVAHGSGLVDRENINWWEFFVLWYVEPIQLISCLQRFVASLHPQDEIFVTRPCLEAEILRRIVSIPLHFLSKKRAVRKLQHYFHELWSLSNRDLMQVFWDKYDERFVWRRRFAKKKANLSEPAVLIPSAYVNATRTGLSFIEGVPAQKSLLVTTRSSGEIHGHFRNIEAASLAGYFSVRDNQPEQAKILDAWKNLVKVLAGDPQTSVVNELGILDPFPKFLKRGLAIRDAWINVMEDEPIQAVLSCDNNPDTMIPILLARNKGIPTTSIHHGALDWRHRFVPVYADAIIAKGQMEEDHLARVCSVSKDKIKVGVPAEMLPRPLPRKISDGGNSIVFFSEAYEPNRVRGVEMYKEIIPQLADLAIRNQRELVIKLHPFESWRKRKALLTEILLPEQLKITKIVTGPLVTDLLKKVWFGVTVLSTVAMECQAANVPCFVCSWLEYPHHEYGDQFRRFGVGYSLQSSEEIKNIPAMLEHLPVASIEGLWRTMSPSELQELFRHREKLSLTAAQ